MLPVKISNFSAEIMFGCVAHVINLAAKAGIMYLGQNWLSRSQSTANLEFPEDENDAVLVGSDVVDPVRDPSTGSLSSINTWQSGNEPPGGLYIYIYISIYIYYHLLYYILINIRDLEQTSRK